MGRKRHRYKKGKRKPKKPSGPPMEAPACTWLLVKNPGGYRSLQFGAFLTKERALEWVTNDAVKYTTGMYSATRPAEIKWKEVYKGGTLGNVVGHQVEYLIKQLEVRE